MKKNLQINHRNKLLPLTLLLGMVGMMNLSAQSVPTGAINGVFSVGENTTVLFSQGNLQYKASTNTWRFAENQFDFVGSDNSNISQTYSGFIDLFGWGTSGYNHGANCYQPWSTSTNDNDYYAYGSSSYHLNNQTGQADWGYNAISNGGNQENLGWRTPTQFEWFYLFNTRSTNSGIRYAKAKVNGVNGVILVPDDWNADYYTLSNPNTPGKSFSSNVITATQWATLEQHGAVFLPAAGDRYGTSVNGVGSFGYYWSASYYGSNAWIMQFYGSSLDTDYNDSRSDGRSVRLVRASRGYSLTIGATPSPAEGGAVSGAGAYEEGAECTLTATPSAGYTFAYWTQNGRVVSADASYTFMVGNNRDLVAHFAPNGSTGKLNGLFSVGENTGVRFSQGNLQYKASTNIWRFAENQYDYVGYDNSNISQTYSGLIDLFGWGTSGYNHGANCYQPWSTSQSNSDYYAYGSYNYNLYDQTGQADWGYNAISNGGNMENSGWRTLTENEWDYLCNTRVTASGIRYAIAQVSNVNGVILLPDDWNSGYYTLNSANTGASFSTNVITASQWATLEQHGAVFLPAAGFRYGTSVYYVGSFGNYSLASCYNLCYPYLVGFSDGYLGVTYSSERQEGQSVRLVCSVENYSIHATPSSAEGGAVSGAGTYLEGAGCTLTATASADYTFAYWTENGHVVSEDASYTFTVGRNRDLVAHFAPNGSTGKLNGQFTVGENAVVCFSQGNLQYKASTNTWRFAESQWDYVGADNWKISQTYGGLIDLFGWGTSGYNHGANCYQPWSASMSSSDYYAYGSYNYNLYDQTGQADWGYDAISNGGNEENSGWRTLTQPEWDYLFNSRVTASGIRYAKATVNSVNGVILLPDDWNSGYYILNSANTSGADFSANVITATQWATLEQHGAVFLPAAGYRGGTSLYGLYNYGCYWSASYYNSGSAYGVDFSNSNLRVSNSRYRLYGNSVRLVCPVENYSIHATPSPAEGGAVSGVGTYMAGSECTLTATPSAGYHFVNWTENGEVVSTDAEYTFTVTGDRTLLANFIQNSFEITVTANPSVGGTVTGAGTYNYGSSCTLTATAATGYTFANWTKNGSVVSSNASYSFTVTEAVSYVANFTLNSYSISASANPSAGGTVSGAGNYNYGSSCTLKATPATGYTFTKWTKNGTQVSSNATYTFTVSGAGTYVAQFTKKTYTITATANPTAGGTVTGGGTCEHGSSVTLTATANTGYTFVNWTKNGTQVSTNLTYSFTATAAGAYVANFSPNVYTVTLNTNDGTINSGDVTSYTYGVGATLPTDVTRTGYTFGGWYDNANLTGTAVTSIPTTATGDKTYWAKWTINSYEINATANPSAGGTVSGAGNYNYGSSCTLKATPATGYNFTKWMKDGTQVSTNATYTFTVNAAGTYVAQFTKKTYAVTATANPTNGGTVTGAGTYDHGTSVTLTATPATGYSFVNWTEGGTQVSTSASYQFTLTGARTLAANFSPNVYTVTLNTNDGTVNSGDVTSYTYGVGVTLPTDVTRTGYTFGGWYDNSDLTGKAVTSIPATATGDKTYWAKWTINSYAIAASANPTTGGTVTGAGNYNYGSSCTLTATPATGYNFTKWTKNGTQVSTSASYTFTVNAAGTYVAQFTKKTYAVTATANPTAGGTVTGAGTYDHGTSVTLTATPATGYSFVNWTEGGTQVSTSASYQFTLTGARTLVANFNANTYTVTLNTNNGAVNSGDVTSYTYGVGATLPTDVTRTGYTFGGWYDNANLTGTAVASISTTATGDKTYWAKWTINSYAISASANPTVGGTVSGAGNYDYGSSCTLKATPATGYNFTKWTKNGTQVSSNATYTFTVSGAGTYVAQFTKKTYTITATANPTAGGTVTGGGTYEHGSSVTLTATPATGYTFTNWTKNGSVVSTSPTYSFTATAAGAYVANFSPNVYTVTLNTNGGTIHYGDVTSYTYGVGATLPTDVTRTGYTFGGWYDNANLTGTAVTSIPTTATGDKTFWAKWTVNSYEITATANPTDGGTVTGAGTYNHGTSVTLTATVNEGYVFDGWSKDGVMVSTEPSISFTATEAVDYVAHFTHLSYPVEITAFPTEGGSVTGAGTYYHGDPCTLTAVPNPGYFFVSWTQDGAVVSNDATYSFSVTGPATFVANFISFYFNIIVSVTPEGAGTVIGSGLFSFGETCTLTAEADGAYSFVNWTENGEEVSTDAIYSFTVTGEKSLQANFSLPMQTVTIPAGWSRWSTNVEITLNDLETALGSSGTSIVSQNGAVNYMSGFGWDGAFDELDLSQMYEINVTENVDLTVSGLPADPADHPVTINGNWNWIGYPVQQGMSVSAALANLSAASGDRIKSKTAFAKRFGNSWQGALKTLEPGQGYMYYSSATGTKTFTYPTGSRGGIVEPNVTDENNFWKANPERFANNMNVMAVVEIDGIESASDDVEIGAFVDGECRGSIRLMYVEEIGRYMAFLTIHGETGEPVSFKVKDGNGIRDLDERIAFQVNGMVGEAETPYVLHASSEELSLFPNPANRNERVHVTLPASIKSADAMVEVYNALGVLVGSFQLNGNGELEGFHVSGLYTVKVTDRKGNVRFAKLVVK